MEAKIPANTRATVEKSRRMKETKTKAHPQAKPVWKIFRVQKQTQNIPIMWFWLIKMENPVLIVIQMLKRKQRKKERWHI